MASTPSWTVLTRVPSRSNIAWLIRLSSLLPLDMSSWFSLKTLKKLSRYLSVRHSSNNCLSLLWQIRVSQQSNISLCRCKKKRKCCWEVEGEMTSQLSLIDDSRCCDRSHWAKPWAKLPKHTASKQPFFSNKTFLHSRHKQVFFVWTARRYRATFVLTQFTAYDISTNLRNHTICF